MQPNARIIMQKTDEQLTLLAGIHKQQSETLQILRSLQEEFEAFKRNRPDATDVWAIGYDKLKAALDSQGLEVSLVKLKKYRACDIFRLSTDLEELEVRNIGTENLPRWRFHVGNCKAAIARFEQLSIQDQRRILNHEN